MSALCIVCKVFVTGRKHAVSCDACERWQHRLCGTGKLAFFSIRMIDFNITIYFSHSQESEDKQMTIGNFNMYIYM